jgi:Matrixin
MKKISVTLSRTKTVTWTLLTVLIFHNFGCKKSEETGNQAALNFNPGQTCAPGKWMGLSSGIDLKLSQAFSTAEELTAVQNAIAEWNRQSPNGITLFQTSINRTNVNYGQMGEFRDGEFGIYKKNPWFPEVSRQALAITQYFGILKANNNKAFLELIHADIIFNTEDHTFVNADRTFFGLDFETILLHEMGHFLGFCHDTKNNSIMYPYYNSTNRQLKMYDITELQNRYSSPNTYPQNAGFSIPEKFQKINEGEVIRGVIELRKNGQCIHYENGKIIKTHFVKKD